MTTLSADTKLAFIDVETTGGNPGAGRIIEIGIVLVDPVQSLQWSTLVNPGRYRIPPFVTKLTGIKNNDVRSAPSFRQLAVRLAELLEGRVIVAHNARFDYSFLRHEFQRVGLPFDYPYLCTLRLSNKIYPEFSKHGLDALIERYEIPNEDRHRALGDAKTTYFYWLHLLHHFSESVWIHANELLRQPANPQALRFEDIAVLPRSHGVYFFSQDQELLYVGKSKEIKESVKSHFYADTATDIDYLIAQQVNRVDYTATAGKLSAALLEQHYIRHWSPRYNKMDSEKTLLQITFASNDSEIPYPVFEPAPSQLDTSIPSIVVTSEAEGRRTLAMMAKKCHLCPIALGLESGSGPCSGVALGTCKGICIGNEEPSAYAKRVRVAVKMFGLQRWPFPGPVIITEYGNDQKADMVVNDWIYYGDVRKNWPAENLLAKEQLFDLQTYKILQSHLQKLRDEHYPQLTITHLTQ